jgi:hypothetical protein
MMNNLFSVIFLDMIAPEPGLGAGFGLLIFISLAALLFLIYYLIKRRGPKP